MHHHGRSTGRKKPTSKKKKNTNSIFQNHQSESRIWYFCGCLSVVNHWRMFPPKFHGLDQTLLALLRRRRTGGTPAHPWHPFPPRPRLAPRTQTDDGLWEKAIAVALLYLFTEDLGRTTKKSERIVRARNTHIKFTHNTPLSALLPHNNILVLGARVRFTSCPSDCLGGRSHGHIFQVRNRFT